MTWISSLAGELKPLWIFFSFSIHKKHKKSLHKITQHTCLINFDGWWQLQVGQIGTDTHMYIYHCMNGGWKLLTFFLGESGIETDEKKRNKAVFFLQRPFVYGKGTKPCSKEQQFYSIRPWAIVSHWEVILPIGFSHLSILNRVCSRHMDQ